MVVTSQAPNSGSGQPCPHATTSLASAAALLPTSSVRWDALLCLSEPQLSGSQLPKGQLITEQK